MEDVKLMGVLDAEWRPMGVVLDLASHPRNRRGWAQQWARARKRIFRRACGCLAALAFLGTFCVVGALEQGTVGLGAGAALLLVSIALFGVFAKLAGGFAPPGTY